MNSDAAVLGRHLGHCIVDKRHIERRAARCRFDLDQIGAGSVDERNYFAKQGLVVVRIKDFEANKILCVPLIFFKRRQLVGRDLQRLARKRLYLFRRFDALELDDRLCDRADDRCDLARLTLKKHPLADRNQLRRNRLIDIERALHTM